MFAESGTKRLLKDIPLLYAEEKLRFVGCRFVGERFIFTFTFVNVL
jgi:hypothetical protein